MATRESPATVRAQMGRPSVPRPLAVAATWSWRLLAVAAAAAVVLWLLLLIRIVVLPVVLALLVTTVLAPPARWLRRRGWPGLLATWTVFLGALLVLAGLIGGLSWQAAQSSDELDVNLDQGVEDVKDWLVDGPLGIPRERVEEVDDQARDWLVSGDGLISTVGVDQAMAAVDVLAGLLIMIVLVFSPARTSTRPGGGHGASSAGSSAGPPSSPRSTRS